MAGGAQARNARPPGGSSRSNQTPEGTKTARFQSRWLPEKWTVWPVHKRQYSPAKSGSLRKKAGSCHAGTK